MPTVDRLIERHGPLMTIGAVAEILSRSPEGLRFTMRGASPLAQALRAARVRIGRRVLFRTAGVAELIDRGTESSADSIGAVA